MEKEDKRDGGAKPSLGAKLTITAKITLPDGREIEKVVEAEGGIPSPDQIDVGSTKENFLRSFGVLEEAVVDARNKAGEAIFDMVAEEIKKKNRVRGK